MIDTFEAEYNLKHCLCPKCGSKNVWVTYVGYIHYPNTEYKDENNAWCNEPYCGWKGIVHDLVGVKR